MSRPAGRRAVRRSLAWRLGLLMAVAVVAVLLLVGIVVNRVVSDRYETVITDQQQQRLDDAADILADRIGREVPNARIQAVVLRLATNLGASVSVIAADGTVLAAYGRDPDGDTTRYTSPISWMASRSRPSKPRSPVAARTGPSCRCST